MSGVFQNIEKIGAGGGHPRWVEREVGVNILEDAMQTLFRTLHM